MKKNLYIYIYAFLNRLAIIPVHEVYVMHTCKLACLYRGQCTFVRYRGK